MYYPNTSIIIYLYIFNFKLYFNTGQARSYPTCFALPWEDKMQFAQLAIGSTFPKAHIYKDALSY